MCQGRRDGCEQQLKWKQWEQGRGLNHGTTCSQGEFMIQGFIYLSSFFSLTHRRWSLFVRSVFRGRMGGRLLDDDDDHNVDITVWGVIINKN